VSEEIEHVVVKHGESKLWRPSQWSPETVERFGLHVQRHALRQVDTVLAWSLKQKLDEIRTVAALRAAGVKTLGDQ
jgi:hypothetical protein